MPLKIKGLLLFALLTWTSICFSQKQFQRITSAHGISQSEIYSFLEDSQGFMWFGTVDGLNRYDGYNVKVFNIDKDNPNSISNNTIRCLIEDEFGRIWIGTDDGLCVYDSESQKIHQLNLAPFDKNRLTINAIQLDQGQLYIGTSAGLLLVDVRSKNLESIADQVKTVKLNTEEAPFQVVTCTLGQNGKIWFTTALSLYQLHVNSDHLPRVEKVLDLSNTLPNIRNLKEDSYGNLWIVSHDNGFLRYNTQHKQLKYFKQTPLNPNTFSNKISTVTLDNTGNLWIGTHDKGLLFLKKEYLNDENPKFQLIEHNPYDDRSLSSNLIYSLFVSKSNLLWIGTIGAGINIYDPYRKSFNYYNLHNANNESSSSTNFIRAVYADAQNDIWIGTHNNGLFILKRGETAEIEKIGFSAEPIFHLGDAGDGLTFVCSGLDLSLVKYVNNRLEVMSTLPTGPSFYVSKVVGDLFWVATLEGIKKCQLKNGQLSLLEEYTTETKPAISFNNCRVLQFSEATNELFVGTEGGGLNVIQLDHNMIPLSTDIYQQGDASNTISNNYVRSIIRSANSDLWIGTYEGLNKMYTDSLGTISFKSYTQKNGLPNNTIQSIVEDNQNKLWIGTNRGLCKFDPKTETFTLYTSNDGIQSTEFSEHAIFKKPDNEVIIGGINGINTFFPAQITYSDSKPNTTITDFYLFNKKITAQEKTVDSKNIPLKKSISLTDSIFLQSNQNSIGFEFSAMIYNSPEKIQYAYLLEGFDKEWNLTEANNRKANYTNLGYGDYTFKVKATNNDGIWEETPKRIFISIETPFYYTTLAFVLYGLLAIIAFIFFTNYSILRYTTKNKIMLENQHNKKIRELEELRTRFFINISHDLRTPITLISSPLEIISKKEGLNLEVKNLLHLVQRNVKKLKDMTEQLLDINKVEAGKLVPKLQHLDIVSFVKGEVLLFEHAFSRKGIQLQVNSEEDFYSLSFDADMMSKVLFNMLSNALKHTQQGRVAVLISSISGQSIKQEANLDYDQFIKIKIEDSGDGIKKEDLAKIFDRFYQGKEQHKKGYGIGLSHSKDLVEAHNGFIQVKSIKGAGTAFSIYLPIIHHQENAEITTLPVIEPESKAVHFAATTDEAIPDDEVVAPEKMKILLVEDNADLRDFLGKQLNTEYEVIEAEDGENGLAIAKAHHPDLIISDVMMPVMDGMEFCKALKTNLKTSHLPVILLTAKVDKETKYKGLEIGADDYISKPFEMEHLWLRIKNLLKNRERLRKMFQVNVNLEPSKVTVTSIDEKFLADLMTKIEEGIPDADFLISSLEQEMGMSHSSFYNKIKSLTGQSAKELVFNMRMKRAKQILQDTANIRVSEVAYMVGFTDPKYFSKCFKKYFGAPPSNFTKNKP